jgi:hypothetical protein
MWEAEDARARTEGGIHGRGHAQAGKHTGEEAEHAHTRVL